MPESYTVTDKGTLGIRAAVRDGSYHAQHAAI
jgi:hypothetical protein